MTDEKKEAKIRKSQELASILEMIKPFCAMIDLAHAKESVIAFRNQASFQDSAAVLNPNYRSEKSDIIRMMASALDHLVQFIELNYEIGKMKNVEEKYKSHTDSISKMFL